MTKELARSGMKVSIEEYEDASDLSCLPRFVQDRKSKFKRI